MRVIITICSLLFVASLSTNCNTFIAERTDSVYMDYDYDKLGYKLYAPMAKHFLPYDLEEISGLSYYKDGLLAAVEDEDGILFLIETKSGEIAKKIEFGDSGDYEGVEIIDDHVFVLDSDGDIFDFRLSDGDIDVDKEETELSASNDTEGLGRLGNDLLIALKGSGDIDDNKVDGKAIYRYSVFKRKIYEKEFLSIDEERLNEFISKRKYFNKVNDFDPSGIAVHPITNDIYLLSADKVIVVFNQEKNIKEVIRLNPITYNQAEGICFAPDGTLYISSEGDGGKGKLMTIKYEK